jgi:hypothetical protein
MNVVLTAPIPGSNTPSFPLAGAIFFGFSMPLLYKQIATVIPSEARNLSSAGSQIRIAAPEARCGPKQTNYDEGCAYVLQIFMGESSFLRVVARPFLALSGWVCRPLGQSPFDLPSSKPLFALQ